MWGTAGEYTVLSALIGSTGRLAANALANAQASAAVIVGPGDRGILDRAERPGVADRA